MCALGSSRAAQVGDGPGKEEIWGVLLPLLLTVAVSFVLPDCLFDPDWFKWSKAKRSFLGELFK